MSLPWVWLLPVLLAACTGVDNRAYPIDEHAGRQSAWPEAPWVAAVRGDGPGDLTLVQRESSEPVRNLPKSRQGNPQSYSVFGQRYHVLDSAADFRERGVASWYGRKFHGRPTSSGEPYDMHAMTAAHKHLPVPTFVHVTNLDNGRTVVVKVNDRGPFVEDRIIDLSFAAAEQLRMTKQGTANVEIHALSVHADDAAAATVPVAAATPEVAPVPVPKPAPIPTTAGERYIQVGAFSDDRNARQLLDRLAEQLSTTATVARERHPEQPDRALYRVRLGPFADAASVEDALLELGGLGIEGYETVRTR